MKPYSQDLCDRIIQALEVGRESQRAIARRFWVSRVFVEKLWQRWHRTGVARLGPVGAAALGRTAARDTAPGPPQSPAEGADTQPDRFVAGGVVTGEHNVGRSHLASGRRAPPVSGALASGTRVEANETAPAAQSAPQYPPDQRGRHGTGAAGGVGAPRAVYDVRSVPRVHRRHSA